MTTRRTLWLRLGGLVVSVIALAIVASSMDIADALRIAVSAQPSALAIILVVIVGQLALRALRWRMLLPHSQDGQAVPYRTVVPALLAGYLGNAVLPARLGEAVRAAVVARRARLDFMECFGTTIVERVVDTVTLAVLVCVAASAVSVAPPVMVVTGVVAVAGVVLIALLLSVGLTPPSVALRRRITGWLGSPMVSRVADRLVAFALGVDRGRSRRRLLVAVSVSTICWFLDAFIFWLAAEAVGIGLTAPQVMLIAGVAVLGTAIPAGPGYVGTYELAVTTTAVALGVPGPEALAIAVLVHVITVVPLAAAGAISLGVHALRKDRGQRRPGADPRSAAGLDGVRTWGPTHSTGDTWS
ncbi:MAG: flippase-like domain-containing protein [Chloroflexi bacterium]|nr:flippase-like domain-containing protein [Chloroflexota bacterium]